MTRQRVCLDLGTHVKDQSIRVLDVLVIGPLMIMGGDALAQRDHPLAGIALAAFGVATCYYNGRNYLRVRRQLRVDSRRLP